ncbi:MAG: P-loop NTPase [Oscillospiraceae bacterium]|jgi:Mrp family chromosome partitioning ATPase
MDILENFKNMSEEEANAYLEEFYSCTHDCSACGAECASRTKKPAKKVIAVISGKGGTGKTVMTVLLATALKKRGLKAGILDADIVNSGIPHLLGMKEPVLGEMPSLVPIKSPGGIPVISMALISEDRKEPIIWSGIDTAKAAVYLFTEAQWEKDLDVLLVDMPTGAGDIPLEYYTTMPFDSSLCVAIPGEAAAMPVRRAVNLAEMLYVPVMGIVENFAVEDFSLSEVFSDIPVVASIPYDAALRKAADEGTLESYETDAFDFLARVIEESLEPEEK